MIGLIYFGTIAIWAIFSIAAAYLAIACPLAQRFGTRLAGSSWLWKSVVTALASSILFILPVWDEIVATPQFSRLCQDAGRLTLGPAMDEKLAFGRAVYPRSFNQQKTVFPNVLVTYRTTEYIDAGNGKVVVRYYSISPTRTALNISVSGQRVAWVLKECGQFRGVLADENRRLFTEKLQLKVVEPS